jgi:hypothetical protein
MVRNSLFFNNVHVFGLGDQGHANYRTGDPGWRLSSVSRLVSVFALHRAARGNKHTGGHDLATRIRNKYGYAFAR